MENLDIVGINQTEVVLETYTEQVEAPNTIEVEGLNDPVGLGILFVMGAISAVLFKLNQKKRPTENNQESEVV